MARKVYVGVNVDYSPEGVVLPRSLVWEDGRRFAVDRVLDIRKAASLKAGGTGVRYTVVVRSKQSYMWFDDRENKWFVEGK